MNTSGGQPVNHRTIVITPERNKSPLTKTNSYDALGSDSESSSSNSIEEEAYLPTTTVYSSDSDNDSDSTMSTASNNKGDSLTKDTLQELMEDLDPGCTTNKTKYTYTDISNFQITMWNALARIPAPYEEYGY